MGVYSSSQFLGAFTGGITGGWIYGAMGLNYVFIFCASVSLLWLMLSLGMNAPRHLSSLLLTVGMMEENEAAQMSEKMSQVEGVAEVVVIAGDGVIYLKVDDERLNRDQLKSLIP